LKYALTTLNFSSVQQLKETLDKLVAIVSSDTSWVDFEDMYIGYEAAKLLFMQQRVQKTKQQSTITLGELWRGAKFNDTRLQDITIDLNRNLSVQKMDYQFPQQLCNSFAVAKNASGAAFNGFIRDSNFVFAMQFKNCCKMKGYGLISDDVINTEHDKYALACQQEGYELKATLFVSNKRVSSQCDKKAWKAVVVYHDNCTAYFGRLIGSFLTYSHKVCINKTPLADIEQAIFDFGPSRTEKLGEVRKKKQITNLQDLKDAYGNKNSTAALWEYAEDFIVY
jgi:hypothetical protein